MKSLKKVLLVTLIGVIVLTGCKKKDTLQGTIDDIQVAEENAILCERDTVVNEKDKTNMHVNYKIVYDGEIVKSIKQVEKVTTSNGSFFNDYKSTVESLYSPYKSLEGYTYTIGTDDDTIVTSITMDFTKIDLDRFVEIDHNNEINYIDNGKVSLSKTKTLFENMGATCK